MFDAPTIFVFVFVFTITEFNPRPKCAHEDKRIWISNEALVKDDERPN